MSRWDTSRSTRLRWAKAADDANFIRMRSYACVEKSTRDHKISVRPWNCELGGTEPVDGPSLGREVRSPSSGSFSWGLEDGILSSAGRGLLRFGRTPLAYLVIAGLERTSVEILVRGHHALVALQCGAADIEAEGRLVVERPERHLAGRRHELQSLEGFDE